MNAKDINGNTPLYDAVSYGLAAIARVLVKDFGADVNAKRNDGVLHFTVLRDGASPKSPASSSRNSVLM